MALACWDNASLDTNFNGQIKLPPFQPTALAFFRANSAPKDLELRGISDCIANFSPPPPSTNAVAVAVAAINKAAVEAGSGELLEALKASATALRSLTDDCADSYQEKLREARDEKAARGEGFVSLICRLQPNI